MTAVSGRTVLIATSLKMYMSAAQTRAWVRDVKRLLREIDWTLALEVVVLPTFPLLESTGRTLGGTGIRWGAQNVATSDRGGQTGEVSAAVLAELGCTYAEVGHAERRDQEDGPVLVEKVRQTVRAGMTPIYCVGETALSSVGQVVEGLRAEVLGAAAEVQRGRPAADLVIAYEPIWAIGSTQPADPEYAGGVCAGLREVARELVPSARVIYGGSAGPGTYTALRDQVDGIFLGRFAHDPRALVDVVREAKHIGIDGGRSPAPQPN